MRLNWGVGMAITYGVFALSTTGFVAFAVGHSEALVSPEYYTQALRHDQRMEAGANAQALGQALSSTLEEDGRTIVLHFPCDQVASAQGAVTLYRPSDARADTRVPLSLDEHGMQNISLAGLAPGRWRVQVEWVAAARPYYYERIVEAR